MNDFSVNRRDFLKYSGVGAILGSTDLTRHMDNSAIASKLKSSIIIKNVSANFEREALNP